MRRHFLQSHREEERLKTFPPSDPVEAQLSPPLEEPAVVPQPLKLVVEDMVSPLLPDVQDQELLLKKWLNLKLQFRMTREEFLQVIRLASEERSTLLPRSRRKWESLEKQLFTLPPAFDVEHLSIDLEGEARTYTVHFFSIWTFAGMVFAKEHHAKLLGNWEQRVSHDGVLRDTVDGKLFQEAQLGDSRDLRLLLYYDDTNIYHFDAVESCGMLRVIPANYPHYIRENPRLWWNLIAIPTPLLQHHSLDYFVCKVMAELRGHVDKGDKIWDAHRQQSFAMDVAIIGVLGDLKGRNLLFHFPQSFSKLWRWCPMCWATRDNKLSTDDALRSTEDTKTKGRILESISNPSFKAALSKEWGFTGYSTLFDYGVQVEAALDDVMHTVLMGGLVRQWTIAFTGFYFTSEMRKQANQRCDVYPFTKRQESLSGLATKLPQKARGKLTALAPLLLIARQLFKPSTLCECIIEEMDPIVIDTHGLPRQHSVVDHFVCLRVFIQAVLFTIRREVPVSDIPAVTDLWVEWRDLMMDLQYSQWFHLKEHLLVNHAGLTMLRGGPMPFFWNFANERAHVDAKRANTNNKDDSFQRMKHVLKIFSNELEVTNTPELGSFSSTKKGKPVSMPQLAEELCHCYSVLDQSLLPVRNTLLQQISQFKFRGLTIHRNCFVRFHASLANFYSKYPSASLVGRISSILEHTTTQRILFVTARLYLLSGTTDDTIDGTGFPFVTLLREPEMLVPAACISEEVNVVPVDLDFFVRRNETAGRVARAHWMDWEGGVYTGALVVVPT